MPASVTVGTSGRAFRHVLRTHSAACGEAYYHADRPVGVGGKSGTGAKQGDDENSVCRARHGVWFNLLNLFNEPVAVEQRLWVEAVL